MLVFLNEIILDTDSLLKHSLGQFYTINQVNEYITLSKDWKWLSYTFLVVYISLKVVIKKKILEVGLFFFNLEISSGHLYRVVISAEYCFLFAVISKTIWFYFFRIDYTLEDIQHFYPLSVLSLIGYEDIYPWFIYPLQILNLFELTYWIVLAYLIGREINDSSFDKGLQIVASSYGVGLLIWVVVVMFITINVS